MWQLKERKIKTNIGVGSGIYIVASRNQVEVFEDIVKKKLTGITVNCEVM
jgi:hypothetical protein